MSYQYNSSSKLLITVNVHPGAKKSSLSLLDDSPSAVTMKAFIKSPPRNGKANAELIALLAEKLHVSKGDVVIKKGFTSRHKVVEVSNLDRTILSSFDGGDQKLF